MNKKQAQTISSISPFDTAPVVDRMILNASLKGYTKLMLHCDYVEHYDIDHLEENGFQVHRPYHGGGEIIISWE